MYISVEESFHTTIKAMRDEPIPYFAMLPHEDRQKVNESGTSHIDLSNKNEQENDKRQVESVLGK